MIAVGVVMAPAAFLSGLSLLACASFIAGLIVGKFADPDVRDQEQVKNEGEHEFERYFGKQSGRLWSAYWQVPAKAINHRSKLSHLPPVGTFVATAWLVVPQLLIAWLWLHPAESFWSWSGSVVSSGWFVAFFVGWTVQDLTHRILDTGLARLVHRYMLCYTRFG